MAILRRLSETTEPQRSFNFLQSSEGRGGGVEFQAEIKQCRRLAAEMSDSETARRLLKLADKIEDWLREVDRE
jgi:hypothetical protein